MIQEIKYIICDECGFKKDRDTVFVARFDYDETANRQCLYAKHIEENERHWIGVDYCDYCPTCWRKIAPYLKYESIEKWHELLIAQEEIENHAYKSAILNVCENCEYKKQSCENDRCAKFENEVAYIIQQQSNPPRS